MLKIVLKGFYKKIRSRGWLFLLHSLFWQVTCQNTLNVFTILMNSLLSLNMPNRRTNAKKLFIKEFFQSLNALLVLLRVGLF